MIVLVYLALLQQNTWDWVLYKKFTLFHSFSGSKSKIRWPQLSRALCCGLTWWMVSHVVAVVCVCVCVCVCEWEREREREREREKEREVRGEGESSYGKRQSREWAKKAKLILQETTFMVSNLFPQALTYFPKMSINPCQEWCPQWLNHLPLGPTFQMFHHLWIRLHWVPNFQRMNLCGTKHITNHSSSVYY
jgi:hypothetical protein